MSDDLGRADGSCGIEGMIWPLAVGDTLSSYEWHPFHHHRFLYSDFLAEVILDGARAEAFTAVMLWSISINQNPAGTLPTGDRQLAGLARFHDVGTWQAHRGVALHGWVPVQVENAATGAYEARLGHEMTLAIVTEMMDRKRADRAKRSADADRKRKGRIKAKMKGLSLPADMVENDWIHQRLLHHFNLSDLQITDANVAQALADVVGYKGRVVPMHGASFPTHSSG